MTTRTRVLILSMTVESGRETCSAAGVSTMAFGKSLSFSLPPTHHRPYQPFRSRSIRMGVFQKVVDTARRIVKKSPQPQSDINTVSYYQYFLPCQDEDTVTIQVEDLPGKRGPCVNLKTLEGWKDFQAKSDVLLTEDDSTSPEPSRRQGQLGGIVTDISLLPMLQACHVVEREYSEQDLVAIYEAIGGYVFIHSKINILPMTSSMHIAWDRGLILIYIREQKVLSAYDGRDVKVGLSPKFDPVEKGIAGFKYCGQTRAHPILLLYKSRGDEGEEINGAREDKGDKKGGKSGKGDKGGKKGERDSKGGNDGEGQDDGAGKDRGQDGGPRESEDLPHEGMVIHCIVMEEVSSTFANDGWAYFDGVVVDNPRPTSTASMTEAQSIAAVWRNPHTFELQQPSSSSSSSSSSRQFQIDFTYAFGNPYITTTIAATTTTTTTTTADTEIDV
ncbi:hypothetical protein EV368DRAFT_66510 [Lentinula lateritia]|nr:hypothetical protein EV368DRAFT_66510 [Lentinula lateritia]